MVLAMVASTATGWMPPVEGPVVRPFDPPSEAWSAGHRGIDLAAPPGTPVRAAGAGRVSFAGPVAGGLHVVVTHPDGWRTSYSYLARVDVAAGAPVERGAVLGVSGGTGPGHGPGAVHVGLRLGRDYVDPAPLLGLVPLGVRLAPLDGPPSPTVCPPPGR